MEEGLMKIEEQMGDLISEKERKKRRATNQF